MKYQKFPITQMTISNKIGRPINSVIRMSNLKDFYIQPKLFLKTFAEFFDDLPWTKKNLDNSIQSKKASIVFGVSMKGLRFFIAKDDDDDFPVNYFFKKEFHTKPIHHVFGSVFLQFYKFIQDELPRDFVKIEIQFLRKKISKGVVKNMENEDSKFEGSVVILHRENISGGESQIIEKQKDSFTEVIFQQQLEAGDFVFLKDKNGGSLKNISHQLTPLKLEDESKESGWIDLMRFEIIE